VNVTIDEALSTNPSRYVHNVTMCAHIGLTLSNTSEALAASEYIVNPSY
jgi:hypothetical protein